MKTTLLFLFIFVYSSKAIAENNYLSKTAVEDTIEGNPAIQSVQDFAKFFINKSQKVRENFMSGLSPLSKMLTNGKNGQNLNRRQGDENINDDASTFDELEWKGLSSGRIPQDILKLITRGGGVLLPFGDIN